MEGGFLMHATHQQRLPKTLLAHFTGSLLLIPVQAHHCFRTPPNNLSDPTHLLNIIIRQRTPILQLLPGEDQTLLVRRDALLVLDLGLDVVDGVGGFDFEGDGFAREGLDEALGGCQFMDWACCGRGRWERTSALWLRTEVSMLCLKGKAVSEGGLLVAVFGFARPRYGVVSMTGSFWIVSWGKIVALPAEAWRFVDSGTTSSF